MARRNRRPSRRNRRGPLKPQNPNFLPMTPGYEATRRGADDTLAGSLANLTYQRSHIPGMVNMFNAREGTDIGYETQGLNENMVERGIYDSGIRPQLQMRDITIPHTRAAQDFGLRIEDFSNELAMQEAAARLGYNQSLVEAMLNRGQEVAQTMPLSLPGQYPGIRKKRRNRKKGKK